MKRFLTFYVLGIGAAVAAIAMVLRMGRDLAPSGLAATRQAPAARPAAGDIPTLLLEVAVIVLAARALGAVFRKIGQPQVVGEMAAGILLGPSLLGWALPGVSAFLFPASSLSLLNALCQLGLIVFMFLVGVELDPELLKGRVHVAVVTSHASIVAPFLLGTLLALLLFPRFGTAGVPFSNFALFVGIAMSITAFPVLARILIERKLERSPMGAVALSCAAVDDVSAWCILALVIVLARGETGGGNLPRVLLGTAAFVGLMFSGGRAAFRRFGDRFRRRGSLTQDSLAVILLCVLAAAWLAEEIGIHALFGAFVAGAMMPRDRDLARALAQRLEDFAVVLLLPLFFAYTGLRTSVRFLDGASAWGWAGVVLVIAVAGKLGGSAGAARFCGMSWRDATAVGVLMNTRGLMELVVLNIGLDIGVISPAVFTMFVLMALATTFMTSPLLRWTGAGRTAG